MRRTGAFWEKLAVRPLPHTLFRPLLHRAARRGLPALALCAAGFASLSAPAWAQKAGDDIVSVGVAAIRPDASLGTQTSTGPLATAFNAATAGASADISREVTASLSWLHLFTDRLGVEFTLGVPPKHTVDLRTPSPFAAAAEHPAAATLTVWTPAAVGKYFFGSPTQGMRPYLGLGVSRVSFHEVEINRADPTVVQLAGTSASVRSRWTPVYNAGLIHHFNERWSLNASVAYLPIRTETRFVGAGGTVTQGDLDINTVDWVVRLGYRF